MPTSPRGRRSCIISHAWLHAFGMPAGMRAIPLAGNDPRPAVGILTADRQPTSIIAAALLDAIADLDVVRTLDRSTAAALAN